MECGFGEPPGISRATSGGGPGPAAWRHLAKGWVLPSGLCALSPSLPPHLISMLTLNAARVSPRLVFQRAAPAARRAAPLTVRAMSGEPALDKSTPEEVRDGLAVW